MTQKEKLQGELIEKQSKYIAYLIAYPRTVFGKEKHDIEIRELEQSISQLQSEVSYPREFVEWINWEDDRDNFHYIKDYTTNKFLNCDENMKEYTTDELFDYWQSKVKNE